MTAMPNHDHVHEATPAEIARLLQALGKYEPVVDVPHGRVHVLGKVKNERGPAVSPTAGPRAGLPQPDKADANTPCTQANASACNRIEQDGDMAQDTYSALEGAIAAHISETSGEPRLLTDWYLVSASVGDRMEHTVYHHICSNSPGHALEGLLAKGLRRMTAGEEYGDDE